MGKTAIARELNKRGIPNPTQYKIEKKEKEILVFPTIPVLDLVEGMLWNLIDLIVL